MRILIVTGSFPPAKCGVGEYSSFLAQALAAPGAHTIGILTSRSAGPEPPAPPGVEIFRIVSKWDLKRLLPTLRFIAEYAPDLVHIQYPTQGYDGRLPKALPLFLRLLHIPVVQTWHEHFTESISVGWPNLLACSALIHVRPDFPRRLPAWVRAVLGNTPLTLIRSASTVPAVVLDRDRRERVKKEFSSDRPIVCFFGFANPNKGVERLFDVADPAVHHLVLLCDLDPANSYHARILRRCGEGPWAGHVTVTGFQPASRVAECLAVADAALFPFLYGAGEWNSSLQAAEAAGVFSVATTDDRSQIGDHPARNVYFCGRDRMSEMRQALTSHLGRRIPPQTASAWTEIASAHEGVYRSVCDGAGAA